MAENKLESIVVKGVEYDIGSSSPLSEFPISEDIIKTETEEIILDDASDDEELVEEEFEEEEIIEDSDNKL